MLSIFASPGDDYLRRIGELAYAVSSLEWLILGDLSYLSHSMPADLSVDLLAGRTTGRIAKAIEAALDKVEDPAAKAFLEAAAEGLSEVSDIRNDVLHARPATIDGEQRLYRWRAGADPRAFVISSDWLDAALSSVVACSQRVHARRIPLP